MLIKIIKTLVDLRHLIQITFATITTEYVLQLVSYLHYFKVLDL